MYISTFRPIFNRFFNLFHLVHLYLSFYFFFWYITNIYKKPHHYSIYFRIRIGKNDVPITTLIALCPIQEYSGQK